MSYQIEQGNFNPSSDFVDIAGTFNGWGSTPLIKLFDTDADQIYEIDLQGYTPGSSIEFKFRINSDWGTAEFPDGGSNRVYTIQADNNVISVWYNNETSSTGPPVADFAANSRSLFENGIVNFEDRSAGAIEHWEWIFEGGSPAKSDQQEPIIVYPSAGDFDVTLIVSNADASDTLIISDFIHVNERDRSEASWWNNTVFYELFVRSFYDSDGNGKGDFKGITEKLDYLNDGDPDTDTDLGITGIWLMPINESPSYHGYDVVDYRSIESDYGNMSDFKEFLSEAHNRGIRVIIDFVMNHSSTQHPWFQQSAQNNAQYRNFYRWSDTDPGYTGPWGQDVWHSNSGGYYYGLFWGGMPDLNYVNDAVKDSMFAAADFWLDDIGVDGFRLDAVKYIFEEDQNLEDTESTFQFWNEFNGHIKQTAPDAFSVGEAWTNTETVLKYITDDRLDYCFEFDLASHMLNAVDNGDARGLSAQMQKVYNLYPHLQYGTFLTNHDQNRVMSVFGSDLNKAKTAAALYLTLPGVPYLYYGEEIGMTGSKPDEYIRTPMQWSNSANAGFTSGSPWLRVNSDYTTKNVLAQQTDPNSLLNWYKKLISIRTHTQSLRLGDYSSVESSSTPVMAFLRWLGGERMLVIVNTSPDEQAEFKLTFPGNLVEEGSYYVANFMGRDEVESISINNMGETESLSIDGYGVNIYSLAEFLVSAQPENNDAINAFQLHQNFPNPFNPSTRIAYSLARSGQVDLRVFDIRGREIEVLINNFQQAGFHAITFDGSELASGVYFYSLQLGQTSIKTQKMMLIR